MAVISNTAPYTPPTNLNTNNLTVSSYSQPSSIWSTASSQPTLSQTYGITKPLAMAPSQSISIPASNQLTVTGIKIASPSTMTVTGTTPSASTSGASWLTVLGNVASTAINVGANVLLAKYATQPTANNTTTPNNPNGDVNQAPTPVVVYDPANTSQENADATSNFLNTLLGGFINKQTSPSGEVTSVQPSMTGYLVIGAIVLVAVILLTRR